MLYTSYLKQLHFASTIIRFVIFIYVYSVFLSVSWFLSIAYYYLIGQFYKLLLIFNSLLLTKKQSICYYIDTRVLYAIHTMLRVDLQVKYAITLKGAFEEILRVSIVYEQKTYSTLQSYGYNDFEQKITLFRYFCCIRTILGLISVADDGDYPRNNINFMRGQ